MQTATPTVRRKQSQCGPITPQELISSNETSNYFLGATQRAWMVSSNTGTPPNPRDRLPSKSHITEPKPAKSAPITSIHASFKSSGKFDHLAPLPRPVEDVAIERAIETAAKDTAPDQQFRHATAERDKISKGVQRPSIGAYDNTRTPTTNSLQGHIQTNPSNAKEQQIVDNVPHPLTSRSARPSPVPDSLAVQRLQTHLTKRPSDTNVSTINTPNAISRIPLPSPVSASDTYHTSPVNGSTPGHDSIAENNFEFNQQQQLITPMSSPMETHLGRKRSFPPASVDLHPATRRRLHDQSTLTAPLPPPAGLAVSSNRSQPAEISVLNREIPVMLQENTAQERQGQPISNKANSYLAEFTNTLSEMSALVKFDRVSEFRIAWVREACVKGDLFFLLLHQLVCMSKHQRPMLETRFGLNHAHYEGFSLFEALFEKNDSLPTELLAYFAGFPNSPHMLDVSPELNYWVGIIKDFLPGLQRRWEFLKLRCTNRLFPPSALEIEEVLRCPRSVVLPRAFFSSIDRQIFPNYDATWANKTYQFFHQNQQRLFARTQTSEMQSLSRATREHENQSFGAAYQQLRTEYEQRQQQIHHTQSINTAISESSRRNSQPQVGTSQLVQQETPATLVAPPRPTATERGERGQATNATQAPIQGDLNEISGPRGHPSQQVHLGRHSVWPRFAYVQGVVDWRQPTPATQTIPLQPWQTRTAIYASLGNPQNFTLLTPQLPPNQSHLCVQQGGGNRQLVFATPFTANSMLTASQVGIARASIQLLPELGQIPPLLTNPDPLRIALHQAHLATPTSCLNGTSETSNFRLYQYISSFAMKPFLLSAKQPFSTITFFLTQAELDKVAIYVHSNPEFSGLPMRYVEDKTKLFNLRCIEVGEDMFIPDESQWSSSATSYPQHCFISINDHHLELRRKRHFKKDLPVDVTQLVRKGSNTVVVSIHPALDEAKKYFALGVEIVELSSHERAITMPEKIESQASLSKIMKALKPDDHDEDLIIDNSHVSIDLKDPFTSQLVEIPVRGKSCLHRECFDLEAFLQSRTCEARDSLTEVYQWLCPYCKRDVRPPNLVIDGFLCDVSQHLTSIGKIDTRAIHVREDGDWEARTDQVDQRQNTSSNNKTEAEDADGSQPTSPNPQLHTPVSTLNAFTGNITNVRGNDHFQRDTHTLEVIELE